MTIVPTAVVRGLLLLALGLHTLPPFASENQPLTESESWGEPVDGVQLRLTRSARLTSMSSERFPALDAQIRNLGTEAVTYGAEAITFPNVEIDAVWYSQAWAGSCCTSPTTIDARGQSDLIALRLGHRALFEVDVTPARTFNVRPGPHTIRIRTVSDEQFSVRIGNRRIVLISNAITIDIPAADRTGHSATADSQSARRHVAPRGSREPVTIACALTAGARTCSGTSSCDLYSQKLLDSFRDAL